MPNVTRIIKQQHRATASVLFALRALTRQALRFGNRPDFRWLRTLVEYVERFPERLHHPNEETYLYRVLLRREPGTARMVARLRRDHAASTGYANRLRAVLADWERGDPKAGSHSVHVANDFVRFMRRHARFEEREILPIARAAFTEAEWRASTRPSPRPQIRSSDRKAGSNARRRCAGSARRRRPRITRENGS
jgi:branched-chain amino acid transport system ATP-binding protein